MPVLPPGKIQLNVYLPAELVREAKHAAVDLGESMSAFVEFAVAERLTAIAAGPERKDTSS